MRERIERVLDGLLVLYAMVLGLRPLDEADPFFHLSLGRAVLRAGARVVPEPTAFGDFTDPAIASEWLWSVLSYAAYSVGSWQLLSLLGCALGGAVAYCQLRLVRRWAAPDASPWGVSAVGVLALAVIQCRSAVRPELALLIALPLYLLGCRAYAAAELPRRLWLGLGLTLGSVLWAQLHGSFVLTPALFVLQVADPRSLQRRARLRCDGLCFGLLLASQLTSAYGLHISELIGSHAAGDAPRYIAEMARPSWAMLDPFSSPGTFGYWALLALGAAGMLIQREIAWRALGLAALGAALLATANRFIAEAAQLAVPLALAGVRSLDAHYRGVLSASSTLALRGVTAAAGCALLALTASQMQAVHGPIGELGVAAPALPLYAAGALRGLPPPAAVLTDYTASSVVGFLGDGALRTFVDGRTPLYFDATDFAVSREMARDPEALRVGAARYGASAAVVRRDSPSCVELARDWPVALIEPLYTTFAKTPAAPPLRALSPCGASYLPEGSCSRPELPREIGAVEAAGARELARLLRAEQQLTCRGDAAGALRELRALAPGARAYRPYFERVLARALLETRAHAEAEALIVRALDRHEAGMLALLQLPAAGELPLSAARRILERYLDVAGDDADLGARAALAEICARAGDEDCARFQATRAAVRGRPTSALGWLAEHHTSARVRADARRWQAVLTARTR